MKRKGYKGFVSEARVDQLRNGEFSVEFSIERHDARGVTGKQFYIASTFLNQESAIEAAIHGRLCLHSERWSSGWILSGLSVPNVGRTFRPPGGRTLGHELILSAAINRRSRWGPLRGWPVLSSHLSPGAAPQVGQRTASTCFGVSSFFITGRS